MPSLGGSEPCGRSLPAAPTWSRPAARGGGRRRGPTQRLSARCADGRSRGGLRKPAALDPRHPGPGGCPTRRAPATPAPGGAVRSGCAAAAGAGGQRTGPGRGPSYTVEGRGTQGALPMVLWRRNCRVGLYLPALSPTLSIAGRGPPAPASAPRLSGPRMSGGRGGISHRSSLGCGSEGVPGGAGWGGAGTSTAGPRPRTRLRQGPPLPAPPRCC